MSSTSTKACQCVDRLTAYRIVQVDLQQTCTRKRSLRICNQITTMDEPMPMEGASLTPSSSNNFTDPQHKILDEAVTSDTSNWFAGQQELSRNDCATLLQCIINRSEGKLKGEFTNHGKAIELMSQNPKLESALKNAWRTKDYKEIRKSSELRTSSLARS